MCIHGYGLVHKGCINQHCYREFLNKMCVGQFKSFIQTTLVLHLSTWLYPCVHNKDAPRLVLKAMFHSSTLANSIPDVNHIEQILNGD